MITPHAGEPIDDEVKLVETEGLDNQGDNYSEEETETTFKEKHEEVEMDTVALCMLFFKASSFLDSCDIKGIRNDNEIKTDTQSILEQWAEYFTMKLEAEQEEHDKETILYNEENTLEEINKEELDEAIKDIKLRNPRRKK
ncbi:hypothetical protein FQA39_LY04037 [Lamprigera yunnana]|nr:hypothetical protein FQA39_LY04037 [Lamprigera yunnana]